MAAVTTPHGLDSISRRPTPGIPVSPVAPAPATAAAPGSRVDPLGSLRKHRFIAVVSALAVILLGLPVVWFKGKPRYSATAVIYVSPRFVANLHDDKEFELQSNSQYREYVQQNVRTINRYDIVSNAIENLGQHKSY